MAMTDFPDVAVNGIAYLAAKASALNHDCSPVTSYTIRKIVTDGVSANIQEFYRW